MTTPRPNATEPERVARAGELLAAGRPAEAFQLVRDATAASGAPARLMQARCLAVLGRHDEALAVYRALRDLGVGDDSIAQRIETLERSLAPPAGAGEDRPWTTSIPKAFLDELQHAIHGYTYAGIPLLKSPFDLAIYARLLHDLRPALIVEIGSKSGGSAVWLADQTAALGFDCRVLSVDVVGVRDVRHDRVDFLEGDGRHLDRMLDAHALEHSPRPWLVIDDADHAYATCKAVAGYFGPLLKPGDMLVVEDGIITDLAPEAPELSGPHRAIRELIDGPDPKYEIAAEYCDMFGPNVTWCTNGYLRRIQ